MEARLERRRTKYKLNSLWGQLQSATRNDLANQQRTRRAETLAAIRSVITEVLDPKAVDLTGSPQKKKRPSKPKTRPSDLVALFGSYDVLLEPPPDLLEYNWFVKPRPDGKRALLVTGGGDIRIFGRDGRTLWQALKSSVSRLNRAMLYQLPMHTILEGIWLAPEEATVDGMAETPTQSRFACFLVLDVLVWNQVDLTECDFEMRDFTLRSKFEDFSSHELPLTEPEVVGLGLITSNLVTSSDLTQLYNHVKTRNKIKVLDQPHDSAFFPAIFASTDILPGVPLSFDGIIFFRRDGSYISDAKLHWRCPDLSQWTDSLQNAAGEGCIRWRAGAFMTEDGVPCRVDTMTSLAKDSLVRLKFSAIQVTAEGLLFKEAQLLPGPVRRRAADTAQKLMIYSSIVLESGDSYIARPPDLAALFGR